MWPCSLSGRKAPVTLAGSSLHFERSRSSGSSAMLSVVSKVLQKSLSTRAPAWLASVARCMMMARGTKTPPQKAWCSKPILKDVLPWSKMFTRRSTPATSRNTKRAELASSPFEPSFRLSQSAARKAPEFRPSRENWQKGSTAFVPSSLTSSGSSSTDSSSASRQPRKPAARAGGAAGSAFGSWGVWASWQARYHQRSRESSGLLAAISSALPRSWSSSLARPPTKFLARFSWPSRMASEAFAILCRRPRTEEKACRAQSPSERSSGESKDGRS
mmetsp:Transcript_94915/g.277525  ORF Transcript_94915/g.277525 Transcript_94915/m.277525 type:complete len:274 (-) Transcript_94915:138-959(-)